MNRAILTKFVRDSWITFVCVAVGCVGYVILFVWAMQSLGPQLMNFLSSVDFLKRMLELAYGISLDGDVSSNVLYAIALTHPIVLALSWGFLFATCTRTTVGEADSGTADLLLTLPVSRSEVFACSTAVWAVMGSLISLCPLLGVWLGSRLFEPTEPIVLQNFVAPSVNFLLLNLAIGALALLVSCFVSRRVHAIAIVVALSLLFVTMNFLEPFLSFIERIRFLSLLNYYRPADAVRTGNWPIGNMASLVGIAVLMWLAALWRYSRQDVPAP